MLESRIGDDHVKDQQFYKNKSHTHHNISKYYGYGASNYGSCVTSGKGLSLEGTAGNIDAKYNPYGCPTYRKLGLNARLGQHWNIAILLGAIFLTSIVSATEVYVSKSLDLYKPEQFALAMINPNKAIRK